VTNRSNDDKLGVSAVLFDIDGTMIDTVHLIIASHRHTFNEILGWVPSDDEILATVGEPLVTTFARYDQSDRLLQEYIDWSVPRTVTHCQLFDGIRPTLETLRSQGFLTGVVTARRCDGMHVCLDAFYLNELFDVTVCAEETERHKPEPDPIFLAMERLNIKDPQHILYVGDTVHDLLSVKRAGGHFAAVDWTAMDKEAIEALSPTLWISHFEELPDRLQLVEA